MCFYCGLIFFFKQKTAYEMRISDWSSDVCSSDLAFAQRRVGGGFEQRIRQPGFAVRLDRGREQRLLVAEMAVDGELGDAGFAGDLVPAGSVAPVLGDNALGGIEDRRAPGESLRPAGGGWPGRAGGRRLAIGR